MARIAHLSDIHFGAHDPATVAGVETWLAAAEPDLVIISGDFTQRARRHEFAQAAAWLARLREAGHRLLMVPGNHDIPFYDVARRFVRPLNRYARYIDSIFCPWFENEEVAVLGLNTARSLTFKDGRINSEQVGLLREKFAAVPAGKTRILVTHHPLYAMPIGHGGELSEAVGRHDRATKAVCEAGVRIALAGHFHRTYAEAAHAMTGKAGAALVVQAGTTTSTRLRNNEPQSFNWIHANGPDEIELQVVAWDGTCFARASHVRFRYVDGDWVHQKIDDDQAGAVGGAEPVRRFA